MVPFLFLVRQIFISLILHSTSDFERASITDERNEREESVFLEHIYSIKTRLNRRLRAGLQSQAPLSSRWHGVHRKHQHLAPREREQAYYINVDSEQSLSDCLNKGSVQQKFYLPKLSAQRCMVHIATCQSLLQSHAISCKNHPAYAQMIREKDSLIHSFSFSLKCRCTHIQRSGCCTYNVPHSSTRIGFCFC